jgi:hypothetical protein
MGLITIGSTGSPINPAPGDLYVRTNIMKTIRTILTKKHRRSLLAVIFSIVILFISIKLGRINLIFIIIGFSCFLFGIFLFLSLQFAVRCPECGGILGFALNWPPTWDLSVPKQIKYCQFCGVSLDKEIESEDKK